MRAAPDATASGARRVPGPVFEPSPATDDDTGSSDPTRDKLVDSARELFTRFGIQRTSMEDVAQHAGLSRITLYRKFDTRDALVEEVVHGEFHRYLKQFLAEIAHAPTAEERLVAGFVNALQTFSQNPLVGGLIHTEPLQLAGSIGGDHADLVATLRQFVASQLRHEQRAGTIAQAVDAELTAEIMVRIASSFLIVPSALVDLADTEQLNDLAWRYLVPMLHPAHP